MQIRPMTREDLPRVLAGWNATLVHDQLREQDLCAQVLEDPNYEPEGVVVAEEDGEILGLSACVLRREVQGKDGRGSEEGFDRAYLKGFFVVEGERGEVAARELLAAAETYSANAGKQRLVMTEYAGPYMFPGLDVRYERLRAILVAEGFRDIYTIEDVETDLRDAALEPALKQAWAKMPAQVKVIRWEPSLLPAMRQFVAEGNMPEWFPPGWEKGLAEPRERVLILAKGEEILAWAQFWPGRPMAGFGPILVLERARGNGYGSVLLLESMVQAREAGAERMSAGWANTGFYARHGWQIVRRYAVLKKNLRQGGKS